MGSREHEHVAGHGHVHAHDSGHDHGHPHDGGHGHESGGHSHGIGGHSHGPARHDRAFAIGISVNIAFVVVEAFYGWRVDSLALLADAGHNLGDVLGLALAWAGSVLARRGPTPRFTYG
ncbi:MAG: cation transporter, partial [Pseudomonadota bacterium]|nr:cation transporter [Pseudomonadota bacterium]